MCGLTALFHPDAAPIDPSVLQAMNDAIAHRGPDGQGMHIAPHIGFAHRRLAIVDVAAGQQPMLSADGRLAIVFNGEIYNFPALRVDLERRGHVFRTRCDTEVILHAWAEWGAACPERLDGMFAFVLWDAARAMLFAARDRLGKKPLHYARLRNGGWAFGSELAAMRAIPGIGNGLDPQAVDDYLAFGYVPDPATIYAGIRKLPAAHCLTLTPQSPEAAPRRYWRMSLATHALAEADALPELRRRLAEATEARLMSDVPLGAFLSGGVDSAGIVAFAAAARARRGEPPLDTFTIAFEGAEDETPHARAVARLWQTRQHEQTIHPAGILEAADQQGRIFGEPFGDSSAVPTAAVCALARRHVTVALSGDGGDEGFAGYRRYRFHMMVEAVRRLLPAGIRASVIATLARAYPRLDGAPRFLRAKTTLTELSLDSAIGYYNTLTRTDEQHRRALLSPRMASALDGHDPSSHVVALMDQAQTDDPLARAQYADIGLWLGADILTKIDRTSMANSLEARAPLLDHNLLEWAVGLPRLLKLRHGKGKYLLRQALRDDLPPGYLDRPKQGFATSLAGPIRAALPQTRDRLLGGAMADCGLFDMSAIGRLIDAHAQGADHAQSLWLLLVFQGFLTQTGPSMAMA